MKLALLVLLSAMIFQVRRKSFVGSDCIGLSIEGKEIIETNETYINSSLWQVRDGKFRIRYTNRDIINILLLLCGDIETCPGPDRFIPELNALLKKRGIKIFHQNVRGLLSNIAFVAELLRSFPAIDILSLSETHITNESEQALFELPGYTFISNHRKTGKGGGVGAYIADIIVWEQRGDLENDSIESTWFEVKLINSSSVLVGIIYRPPTSSKYLPTNFNEHLNEMLEKATEGSIETILLGDVNVNYLVRNDNKEFKSILSLYGFEQMVQKPTRITESTKTLIDIIATNNPLNLIIVM